MIRPKNDQEIEIMRAGGQMLGQILNNLKLEVEPGVTPKQIAKSAAGYIQEAGLQAVLLGYEGYPDVICISVNEAVVHGIPGKEPFKSGDVVKLDLTVAHKGYIVDSALTVICGEEPSGEKKHLLEGTKRSMEAGIAAVKGDGTRVGDIAAAVEKVLDEYKLGVIRDLVGHGVGQSIHEPPNVPNYGVAGTGPILPAGATICIEPMASLGDWKVDVAKDGWTILMRDNSLSAHFEHTVLVTDDGAEILTLA